MSERAQPPSIDGVLIDEMDLATATAHDIVVSQEVAKIEADLEFEAIEDEDWRRRATRKLAYKRFLRDRLRKRMHKVRVRDKPAETAVATEVKSAAKLAKAEAVIEKQRTLREEKTVRGEKQKTAQLELLMRHSITRQFFETAKRMLPPETFAAILEQAARNSANSTQSSFAQLAPSNSKGDRTP